MNINSIQASQALGLSYKKPYQCIQKHASCVQHRTALEGMENHEHLWNSNSYATGLDVTKQDTAVNTIGWCAYDIGGTLYLSNRVTLPALWILLKKIRYAVCIAFFFFFFVPSLFFQIVQILILMSKDINSTYQVLTSTIVDMTFVFLQ